MSSTINLATSTASSAAIQTDSDGLFTNITFVADRVWPGVTCHSGGTTHTSIVNTEDAPAMLEVVPADLSTWDALTTCFQNETFFLFDSGGGCGAGIAGAAEYIGPYYNCLRNTKLFTTFACAAPQDKYGVAGCDETTFHNSSIPDPVYTPKSTMASSTSLYAIPTQTAAPTTTTSARPSGAAGPSTRQGSTGKAGIAVGLLLLTGMAFGTFL